MDEPIPNKIVLEADVEAELDAMLAEMRHLNARMVEDQRDIDRLKAETRRLGEETRTILAEIQATF